VFHEGAEIRWAQI